MIAMLMLVKREGELTELSKNPTTQLYRLQSIAGAFNASLHI
jgi:hypothetical protein